MLQFNRGFALVKIPMAKLTYQERILTNTERRFMLNAERGDCASVAKIIEQSKGERLSDMR